MLVNFKSWRRRVTRRMAMEREPAAEVAEHRRLNTDRCEDMLLPLQPAIAKGHDLLVLRTVVVLSPV